MENNIRQEKLESLVPDEKFFKKEMEEGSLFILEKYLDQLPWDYWDTLMFIFTQGIDQRKGTHLITLDEKESERLLKISTFPQIKVFVWSDEIKEGKKVIWNCILTKEIVEGHQDPKKLFVGGEHLRSFCDKRNIFYKSSLTKDGLLLSGSNLMWLKKEGEDCRKPENLSESKDG